MARSAKLRLTARFGTGAYRGGSTMTRTGIVALAAVALGGGVFVSSSAMTGHSGRLRWGCASVFPPRQWRTTVAGATRTQFATTRSATHAGPTLPAVAQRM